MGGQNCGNCRFYWPFSDQVAVQIVVAAQLPQPLTPRTGSCRRYPRATPDAGDRTPQVDVAMWCGEWVPANPQTVEQGAAVMARLVQLGDMTAARALADKLTGGD